MIYICKELHNETRKKSGKKRNSLIENDMKRKLKPTVSKQRAIEITMNHNGVSREIAEKYTNSELREVLKHLGLRAGF